MHTKCANIMTKLRSIQIDGNSSVELRDLAKEKWHKFVRAHSTVAAAADAESYCTLEQTNQRMVQYQ